MKRNTIEKPAESMEKGLTVVPTDDTGHAPSKQAVSEGITAHKKGGMGAAGRYGDLR